MHQELEVILVRDGRTLCITKGALLCRPVKIVKQSHHTWVDTSAVPAIEQSLCTHETRDEFAVSAAGSKMVTPWLPLDQTTSEAQLDDSFGEAAARCAASKWLQLSPI